MTDSQTFTVTIDQNPYLPQDAVRVDAIVTIAAEGGSSPAPTGGAVELIMIDCSASMRGARLTTARQATIAAIEQIRDGVAFAVIAGNHQAAQLYPVEGTVVADPATRAEAIAAMSGLEARGGTAISTWLTLAGDLARRHPDAMRHAILLTDGKNEHDHNDALTIALDAVKGQFVCDCRGVGTDWKTDELRKIADAMLGVADIVADPEDLAEDFSSIMAAAMDKSVTQVALRLWTPRTATIRFVKAVEPTILDLTAERVDAGPQRGDYPLGSWGNESREYHICVDVSPGAVGDEMLAARVSVIAGGSDEVLGQGLIKAIWTDDLALATQINPGVALYTGQAEMAGAIQEGLAARKAGDVATATAQLARAVALANETGNDATAKLLARVVDVDPSGTVRLRSAVSREDEMTLDIRSTKTVRSRRGQTAEPS